MARVDYDKQSANYDKGRTLPDEAIATWMVSARRHAVEARTILDLGAGTGRFTAALAQTFDARVIAVEPSAGMREQARSKGLTMIGGRAEDLPIKSATIDLAWLSNTIHHFDDIDHAARELKRTSATVLIRGAFGDTPVPSLYRFFPETQAIIETFPTTRAVIDAFEAAGFSRFYREQVEQLLAHDLAEMVPRMRRRADTTLEHISDEAFNAGLALLEETAKQETGPVLDVMDLLVIR